MPGGIRGLSFDVGLERIWDRTRTPPIQESGETCTSLHVPCLNEQFQRRPPFPSLEQRLLQAICPKVEGVAVFAPNRYEVLLEQIRLELKTAKPALSSQARTLLQTASGLLELERQDRELIRTNRGILHRA